jgi:hypothetical protein
VSTPNEPHEPPQAQDAPQTAAAQGQPGPAGPPQASGPAPQASPASPQSSFFGPHPAVDRSQLPPFNLMAIIAFVGAFVIPVVGIVCGHITLREYRRGLPERGLEYALAGTILGYIFTAIWIVLAIVWIVFAFTHLGRTSSFGGYGYQPMQPFPMPSPRFTPNGQG